MEPYWAPLSETRDTHMAIVILIGGVLTGICVLIHAIGTTFLLQWLPQFADKWMERWPVLGGMAALLFVAGDLLFLHFLELTIWAIAYLWLTPITEIPNFETALYFSGSTYTTVGYGDITLTNAWRLLTSIEAMDGMLLLGWSTALLYASMSQIRQKLHGYRESRDAV